MRRCSVETLACLSLLRFPLFNTWGDTINTWRFPSNSTQCTDGLHAVTFRTPLIHSLGHTELLNCVKLYSMYESCYLHKLYNLGLHPWSTNRTAEVFIILCLKTAWRHRTGWVQHPEDNHRAEMTFTCFCFVSSLFLSSLHPLSFLC